jgi:hypothetical protein
MSLIRGNILADKPDVLHVTFMPVDLQCYKRI